MVKHNIDKSRNKLLDVFTPSQIKRIALAYQNSFKSSKKVVNFVCCSLETIENAGLFRLVLLFLQKTPL